MSPAGVTYTRMHPNRLWTAPGRTSLDGGQTETRNPVLWPFSSDSLWNTPLGVDAEYGVTSESLVASTHPMAVTLRSVAGKVNYSTYSTPVHRGVAGDSQLTIRQVAAGTWRPATVSPDRVVPRAPASVALAGDMNLAQQILYNGDNSITFVMPSGVSQPDGFISFIDETALTVTEAYKACWTEGGSSTRTLVARTGTVNTWDLTGDGWTQRGARASALSFTAGLIRSNEINTAATDPRNAIRHALVMALNNSQLLRPSTDTGYPTPGYQWPARGFDSNANSAYTGNIRMGTHFALNPLFDPDDPVHGLSNEGRALAYALRDYGCYVGDRASWSALYAQQQANAAAADRMSADWKNTLIDFMVPVLNSNFATPGGPGERRRPPAPDFA